MKALLAGSLALMVTGSAAAADPCADRFTELFMQLDQGLPTKTFVTTEFKGAPAMTNELLFLSQDHHMTVPVEPPMAWVLTHGNVMYQSSDHGESWAKVRDLDAGANAEGAIAQKRKDAESVRNAVCAEDTIDGVAFDRIAADLTLTQGQTTENRYTYWVRKDTGFIARATYDTKGEAFEMLITQEIEPAPNLVIPVPE